MTIIAAIEKGFLKRIVSVCKDDSYKFALMDKFSVSGFRSHEPNAKLDSRVIIQK